MFKHKAFKCILIVFFFDYRYSDWVLTQVFIFGSFTPNSTSFLYKSTQFFKYCVVRVLTETEPIESRYRYWHIKYTLCKIITGIVSHDYGGLEVSLSAIWKLENQQSWLCNSVLSKGPRIRSTDTWGQEKMDVPI